MIPIRMDTAGAVKVEATSSWALICYWADAETKKKLDAGSLSINGDWELIKSKMIVERELEFSKTVDLPKGENFIFIQKYTQPGRSGFSNDPTKKYKVTYSVKKL